MNKVIEMKKLKKYYKDIKGIEDVTLDIKKGEVYGFIGPNGAGKSTTIRTLLNFIFKTSGFASVFGLDIVKDTKEIKKRVGYLPADVNLYEDMTVENFLKYNAEFYGGKLEDRVKYLCERLNLDTKRLIEDLSTGNKRKVGIVVALMHSPSLLILDEPTTGLDPLMQNVFFEILKEEKEKGTTIFFSSHILSEVKRICDKVAVVKDGKIIEKGSVDKLSRSNVNIITIKTKEIDKIKKIKDIKITEESKNKIKFLYDKDINEIILKISKIKVDEIKITEPDLEEIFIHYYK